MIVNIFNMPNIQNPCYLNILKTIIINLFGFQYFISLIIGLSKILSNRLNLIFKYFIMRHLSAIILIVLMTVLPSCKYFKGKGLFGRKANIAAVWQARQDSTRVADSIRIVQDQLLALENEKLVSVRKADDERLAWENKYKYNIIVGSFITPEYAKGFAVVYRQRGYDTRIIKIEGARFELVSAEAHESFGKAVARLKEFQGTIEPEAWMYIKE